MQVVIVTGASKGIGKATAEILMKNGFHVYGTSRNHVFTSNNHFASDPSSGGFIDIISLDVNSDISVDAAIKKVMSLEGRIDVLVSNAGIGIAGSIEDASMEESKTQFETNFFGTLRVIKALLPIMRAQGFGKIIALSSVAGVLSIPYQAHYSARKFAIEGLIEALRHEIAPFGIKACIVEPGDTKTSFTGSRSIVKASNSESAYYERFKRSLSRMEHDEQNGAPPEAVARVILKAIKKKNPPIRTAVGFQYKLILFLRRIVPSKITEKLIGMLYSK